MAQTGITWRFSVSAMGASSAEARETALEEHLDRVMEEMLALEECNDTVHDPSLGATLATGEVEIEMTVDGDRDSALQVSRSFVRTAIHAAGGFTPRWDQGDCGRKATDESAAKYEPISTSLQYN